MVSVFVKQRTADDVAIQLGERTASITIKLPTGSDYSLELDPLAHEIVPSQSEHFVRSTKIEVKLKKKSIGLKWGALEGDDALVTAMGALI
jgi:suppressor of G2 allele of SKP1